MSLLPFTNTCLCKLNGSVTPQNYTKVQRLGMVMREQEVENKVTHYFLSHFRVETQRRRPSLYQSILLRDRNYASEWYFTAIKFIWAGYKSCMEKNPILLSVQHEEAATTEHLQLFKSKYLCSCCPPYHNQVHSLFHEPQPHLQSQQISSIT